MMKKNSIVLALFSIMAYVVFCSDIDGPAHHGHGDITGATTGTPGGCQTSSCHGTKNPLNVVSLSVIDTTTMAPVSTYNASQTYLIKLTGDATAVTTNLPGFGFQVSAVLGNHTLAGSYTIPAASASNIHTFACGATTVVEQSVTLPQDVTGTNKYTMLFYWTAPAGTTDSVSFFSLLNAVNGDGGKPGDYPNAGPVVTIYQAAISAVAPIVEPASSVSLYPNPATTTLTLSSDSKLSSVVIRDLTGRMLYTNNFNTTQATINVATLAPGTYNLIVNGTEVRKFIKK